MAQNHKGDQGFDQNRDKSNDAGRDTGQNRDMENL